MGATEPTRDRAVPLVCAWCPGFDPGAGPAVTSHGICAACLARVTDSLPPADGPEKRRDIPPESGE